MVPPMAHRAPKMTASMHCPRMKREKQSLVMLHACSTRRRRSSPGMKLAARMAPACTRSLSSSRYSANTMPSRIESVRCATSPLVCATMRSAWSVPPMASRAFCPMEFQVALSKIGMACAPGRFAMACDAMAAASDTPVMMAAPTDLNSPPTNEVSAASAKVTAVMARMTQMGRRVLIASALLVWGNQRDSSAAAMKFSRYASTAPMARGSKADQTVEKMEQRPSNRATASAATARAATRIRA